MDDEKKYIEAPEVEVMIQTIIQKYTTLYELQKVGIKAIFRIPSRSRGSKEVYGTASIVGERMRLFLDADFLIEIWRDGWDSMDEKGKEALIFHELKHCVVEEKPNKKGGITLVLKTKPHDFSGFIEEYNIFGDWRNDLPELKNEQMEETEND